MATSSVLPARHIRSTEVHVVLALNRVVVTTKDSQEFLTIKAALEFYWTDTRLAGFPEKASIPADIWRPELMSCSGLTVVGIDDYAKTPTFDMKPNSRQDGLLKLVGNLGSRAHASLSF